MINKENDKRKDADSLLHDTRSRTQCLNEILHAVPEKSSASNFIGEKEKMGKYRELSAVGC